MRSGLAPPQSMAGREVREYTNLSDPKGQGSPNSCRFSCPLRFFVSRVVVVVVVV